MKKYKGPICRTYRVPTPDFPPQKEVASNKRMCKNKKQPLGARRSGRQALDLGAAGQGQQGLHEELQREALLEALRVLRLRSGRCPR